jgi:peptidoglycan/LPS O-acetylase OafA/YrhL
VTFSHSDYLRVRRFQVLDGLRAIAILLVFTAHPRESWWQSFHGPTGVTLFFVLSGFLITTLLLREEERYGKVDFASFYVRRTFRIYPMFFGVFALYCILILVLGMQADRRDVFVENIPYILLFFPEHMNFFYPPDLVPPFNGAWSIGTEEKFYLVWPLLGFALLSRWKPARVPVLLAVAAISFVAGSLGPVNWLSPYQHLAFGALAAVLLHSPRTYAAAATMGRPPVLLGLAALVVMLQFGTTAVLEGPVYGLFGAVIALLLTGLVTTRSRGVNWLGSRVMVFLAAISYVFYLVHNFVINAVESVMPEGWGIAGALLSAATALVLSALVAWVIHRLYEEPLRKFGVRLSRSLEDRREARRVPAVASLDALAP